MITSRPPQKHRLSRHCGTERKHQIASFSTVYFADDLEAALEQFREIENDLEG
jgi:hypothetical protein